MNQLAMLASSETDNFISFPKLGIYLTKMIRYFNIGKYPIHLYGVIICLGMILCIVLGMKYSKKYAINQDSLIDYVLFGIPFGIIGARIYYVAFSWDYYKENLGDVYKIWEGGLAIYGGVIAAGITILIVSIVKKHSFLHILDFVLPYIMLGQGIGRWGNFINQEAYGSETNSVFGMTGNIIAKYVGEDVLVHPTFLYESIWCIIGFIVIDVYRHKFQKKVGEASALYMIIYGVERAVVEGLRTDSLIVNIGSFEIRVSQWLSVILVVVGIALFIDSKLRGILLSDLRLVFAEKGNYKLADLQNIVREPEEVEVSSFSEMVNEIKAENGETLEPEKEEESKEEKEEVVPEEQKEETEEN